MTREEAYKGGQKLQTYKNVLEYMRTNPWVRTRHLHALMSPRIASNAAVKDTRAICAPHKCVLSQAVEKSTLQCVTPGILSRFFREERVDGLSTLSA